MSFRAYPQLSFFEKPNPQDGNSHPAGPEAHDLPISASMITKFDGENLINVLLNLEDNILTGKFIPITCIRGHRKDFINEHCQPVRSADRKFVDSIDYTGVLTSPGESFSFPFTQANFGSRIQGNKMLVLVRSDPGHGCTNNQNLAGRAVLVTRGTCDFSNKADVLEKSGAILMIIVNNNQTTFRMGIDRSSRKKNVRLASLMITSTAGAKLVEMLQDRNKMDIVPVFN